VDLPAISAKASSFQPLSKAVMPQPTISDCALAPCQASEQQVDRE
jgi:hypothetical protein